MKALATFQLGMQAFSDNLAVQLRVDLLIIAKIVTSYLRVRLSDGKD